MAKKKILKLKTTIKGPARPRPGVGKSIPGGANGGHNSGGK